MLDKELFSLELTCCPCSDLTGYHWSTWHHWVASSSETQLRDPSSRMPLLTGAPKLCPLAGFNACINQSWLSYAVIINIPNISMASNNKTYFLLKLMVHIHGRQAGGVALNLSGSAQLAGLHLCALRIAKAGNVFMASAASDTWHFCSHFIAKQVIRSLPP